MHVVHSRGDKVFRGIVTAGALTSLVILGLIGAFLFGRGAQVFSQYGLKFITSTNWSASTEPGIANEFGMGPMLVGTVIVSVIALTFTVPMSIAGALYIEFYAQPRIKKLLTALLDLAAAIPSLIFGLWGIQVFTNIGQRWASFLGNRLGFIPIFNTISDNYGRSPFVAGCVLASLVVPITTSVAREVYSRTPRELIDTCYALGGTKWGAIKTVVLPFGKSGVVGGAMLGLGRALGETVAVYLVLNLNFRYTFKILESEGGNVASLIATRFGEASTEELTALIAAGFVLFLMTLGVNMIASAIVTRSTRS
ncbi:MAG: hypothetical protein RL278_269 [Actinomycetota bacterium]